MNLPDTVKDVIEEKEALENDKKGYVELEKKKDDKKNEGVKKEDK